MPACGQAFTLAHLPSCCTVQEATVLHTLSSTIHTAQAGDHKQQLVQQVAPLNASYDGDWAGATMGIELVLNQRWPAATARLVGP